MSSGPKMQMRITPLFSTPVPRLSLAHLSSSSELRAEAKSTTQVRSERDKTVGFIPELVSLEASGYIPPSTKGSKPARKHTTPAHSSLLSDIQFQLNTQLAVGCPWKKPPERSSPSTPERSNGENELVTQAAIEANDEASLSESLSALVERIQALQIKKDKWLKEKAAQEQLKAAQEAQVVESQRLEAESLREQHAKEKDRLRKEAEALPGDIRTSLIVLRAVERLEKSDGYQAFLKSQQDDIRRLRVQILKLTSAVPNQLAATCSRLMETYSSVSEVRRSLLQSNTASLCSSILGSGFSGDLEATAKMESAILAPLMTLNLPTFHLYLKLSQVILESCQQQVSIHSSTVWMYAHFLGMLFNGWSRDFQIVFYGCLFKESLWLIPLPVADAQRRKESTSEQLAIWCKNISSLFRLRLAVCQSQKAAGECWKLVARFLNRVVSKLTHPLSVFLLEAIFDVACCQLSELSSGQLLKLVLLCQEHHLAVLKRLCLEENVWAEWKVPVIKLDERLKWIVSLQGIVREKPAGYQMMQQASEIDADI